VRRHRPIDTAAAHGHPEVVEALIQGGADFALSHLLQVGLTARVDDFLRQNPGAANTPLESGTPPLLLAADAETARLLLAAGADASACDLLGRTALHAAIEGERPDVVRVLLDAGCLADIFAAAGMGDSARVGALLDADAGLAQAKQGDGVTALFYAAYAGDTRSCELLLAHGAAVSPRAERFWASLTPLHVALQRGHRRVATLLLKNGADPNAFTAREDRYWPTPLHATIRWGSAVDVDLLLDHGADPNGGDCGDGAGSLGTSGLAWAVFAGDEDVVRLLLVRGMTLRHSAHKGALHLAAEHGKIGVARLLLDNGADPNATNALGETPRQRALKFGRTEVAELLGTFER
jgi:ankyrin repeat protein